MSCVHVLTRDLKHGTLRELTLLSKSATMFLSGGDVLI